MCHEILALVNNITPSRFIQLLHIFDGTIWEVRYSSGITIGVSYDEAAKLLNPKVQHILESTIVTEVKFDTDNDRVIITVEDASYGLVD